MRLIVKNSEPEEWREHRKTEGAVYESRKCLRQALYVEQGGICGYCMQRLKDEVHSGTTNRIEHVKCRKRYPKLQLDYTNMIMCCNGESETNQEAFVSCDRAKHSKEIHFSPLDIRFISTLSYTYEGVIQSTISEYDAEINEVLNLNHSLLKRNRAYVLKGIRTALMRRNWKASQIKKELKNWDSKDAQGLYKPFCGIAVWYLKKKITANSIK